MGESDVVADSDLDGSRGMMVLFVKQVHLQKEVGARENLSAHCRLNDCGLTWEL